MIHSTATKPQYIIKLIQLLIFPSAMIATAIAMYWVQFSEFPPMAMQMLIFISSIFLVMLLERSLPLHQKSFNKDKLDSRLNLTSFAILLMLIDPLLKLISPLLLSFIVITVSIPIDFSVIPSDWNFFSQLILAALIAELGQYTMHRLGHVSYFWRFHSLHHSSSRMNILTGFRVHPINMIYHHFSGVFILMLLGTGELIILSLIALTMVNNVFQHANVKFKHGVLDYIFNTNTLHRWHHSVVKSEANANYGAFLIVWDLVFGSYFNPKKLNPSEYGLFSEKNYPLNSYWKQFIAPLFWNKWAIANASEIDEKLSPPEEQSQ